MHWTVLFAGLVFLLCGGLTDVALGQLIASPPKDSARAGFETDSIKPCRPITPPTSLRETQAIAEVPPAPEAVETIPQAPAAVPLHQGLPVPHFEGGLHPSYVTSAEESHYVSECRHCGQHRCRCTYAPLGDSLIAAFGRQAYLGSVQMMTLYDYDFAHSALTVRGIQQLQKSVQRLEITPGLIKIEATSHPTLDLARHEHVVEMLSAWGIPEAGSLVITIRTERGREAIESLETSEGLLQQIRARGRTIQSDDSATFSGTGVFGR